MTQASARGDLPPGSRLLHTLRGPKKNVVRLSWSADGCILGAVLEDGSLHFWELASGQPISDIPRPSGKVLDLALSSDGGLAATGSEDREVRVFDVLLGRRLWQRRDHSDHVRGVAWSPCGRMLASASHDGTVRLWQSLNGDLLRTLRVPNRRIHGLAWAPDGKTLALMVEDRSIPLLDVATGGLRGPLRGHGERIRQAAWSPDGSLLVSASDDQTIRLWHEATLQTQRILEGHTEAVLEVGFLGEGRCLATLDRGRTLRLWRCDSWETVATVPNLPGTVCLAHPQQAILALAGNGPGVQVWQADLDGLLQGAAPAQTFHYSNAKVVLVGDSGVGKSGLALVLTGKPYRPTSSTHGLDVSLFETREVQLEDGGVQTRETLLWDLAGQPGYRLIHQLHLTDVALAVVVFDARSEIDPFAGVKHWDRALRQIQRLRGEGAPPLRKILVAARADREGIAVSQGRIAELVQSLGFAAYLETSAESAWNIAPLQEAIRRSIDWSTLPRVSSTALFQHIKTFLDSEKSAGRILCTLDTLYAAFLRLPGAPVETELLRAQFDTGIKLAAGRGLVRPLSFGSLVLLRPEVMDSYASALVMAARSEPDGLGSLVLEDAQAGRFRMAAGERLPDPGQERLLLLAVIEDLLRHEIALKEPANDGPHLVFPSQFTSDHPRQRDPEGTEIVFEFEGAVLNIYATLAVRLTHSGFFKKKEMWQSAASYTSPAGGTFGIYLRQPEEGRGELTLFFDATASEEMRFQFEEFVQVHLQSRALAQGLSRRRIYVCPECRTAFTDAQVQARRQRGFKDIRCSVCEVVVSLLDREERLTATSYVQEMERRADERRERDSAAVVLEGKQSTRDWDVFLSYNSKDVDAVEVLARQLQTLGLNPWFDKWHLAPGRRFQEEIERVLLTVRSVAVFLGPHGIGEWEKREMRAAFEPMDRRGRPVIPVLLPGVTDIPEDLLFLRQYGYVGFTGGLDDAAALQRLRWAITGNKPADAEDE